MSRFLFLVALFAGTAPAAELRSADEAVVRPEIFVLPRFERERILDNVSATLDAAGACLVLGRAVDIPRSEAATARYFASRKVDGEDVTPWERTVEYDCRAQPVSRCLFTYVWDDDIPELVYTTIDCQGSFDGPDQHFTITASTDTRGAKITGRGDKVGTRSATVSFFTDSFPGTLAWSYGVVDRGTGEVLETPTITQFDDYTTTDDAAAAPFEMSAMSGALDAVRALSCRAVGIEDCVSVWSEVASARR